MLKKPLIMAIFLGLTPGFAMEFVSQQEGVASAVPVSTMDKPTQVELRIEEMREPHRTRLKVWKKYCETLDNNLNFIIGEMNIKAKAKFAKEDNEKYEKASLDWDLSNRIKSFETFLEELTDLKQKTLDLCFTSSKPEKLSEEERGRFNTIALPLYENFKEFSDKFIETVIYDTWGYNTTKLQDYIADSLRNILELETRLEICTLSDEQKRLSTENLKVSKILYEKYKRYSSLTTAALQLPEQYHQLRISILCD